MFDGGKRYTFRDLMAAGMPPTRMPGKYNIIAFPHCWLSPDAARAEALKQKYTLYCAIAPNRKKYIGQTTQGLVARIRQHDSDARCGKKTPFANALRKYGVEAFEWHIIQAHHVRDEDALNAAEEGAIAAWETFTNGYNAATGGKNSRPNAETKKKMSIAARRRRPPYRQTSGG